MYELDVLIQGFPGKTAYHGGLGWSTVGLLRGEGRTVLIDTGGYNCRDLLVSKLRGLDLEPAGVTDVVLSHCHWDHILNFPLFTSATVHDLASQDPTTTIVCGHDRLLGIEDGRVVYRSELAAEVRARLSADFDAETVFDVTGAVGVR